MTGTAYLSTDPTEPMSSVLAALGGEPTMTITISGPDANKTACGIVACNSFKKNLLGGEKFSGTRILINVNPT